MTDEEDILGTPKRRKRGPGRPRGAKTKKPHPKLPPLRTTRVASAAPVNAISSDGTPAAEVMGGVSIFWLAKAFAMNVSTVRKKLADCPAVSRKTSGFLYSLPIAASYLVRPRVDIAEYMKSLEPRDLPVQLQPTFWDAQLKRQKWEKEAGHLWATEDVVEVFSDVFKAIRFSMQLWPDTVERMTGLSEEQREILVAEADSLQNEIADQMRRMAEEKSTPSAISRLQEIDLDPSEEEPDLVESVL